MRPYSRIVHPFEQPYQQGQNTRVPGHALSAMLAGRSLYGENPMDQKRRPLMPQQQHAGLVALLMARLQQR